MHIFKNKIGILDNPENMIIHLNSKHNNIKSQDGFQVVWTF